jgi:putative isomerase
MWLASAHAIVAPTLEVNMFDDLYDHLITETRRCVRAPAGRFLHPWLAPMPSPGGVPAGSDGFKLGDYSLGLFHHDASEAAIELLAHPAFRAAAAGSLLCLLDTASPDGCVHRAELAYKTREAEPSKPVIAQFAERVLASMPEADAIAFAKAHDVFARVFAFVAYLERNYTGLHGLPLTHSSLQSGFDSDILSAMLPDRSVEGPDTAAFMVLEYEAAAALAVRTGDRALADVFSQKAERLRRLVEALLWHEDERGGFYVALRWQHGAAAGEKEIVGATDALGVFRPAESWTTLLPLYAGIPSPERAEKMLRRLLAPEEYWGPCGVRTAPKSDPFFTQAPRVMLWDYKKQGRGPVSNWSGPIWILANYYMALALERYGRKDASRELALRTAELLAGALKKRGTLAENYDDFGAPLWPRRGTFISWNVLAITLLKRYVPEHASGFRAAG